MINSRKTSPINQNQTVIDILRKNKRRKLTTNQICELVNETLTPKSRLTPTQISKCLNRFSERNMVKKTDMNGKHPTTGRNISRWAYSVGA